MTDLQEFIPASECDEASEFFLYILTYGVEEEL